MYSRSLWCIGFCALHDLAKALEVMNTEQLLWVELPGQAARILLKWHVHLQAGPGSILGRRAARCHLINILVGVQAGTHGLPARGYSNISGAKCPSAVQGALANKQQSLAQNWSWKYCSSICGQGRIFWFLERGSIQKQPLLCMNAALALQWTNQAAARSPTLSDALSSPGVSPLIMVCTKNASLSSLNSQANVAIWGLKGWFAQSAKRPYLNQFCLFGCQVTKIVLNSGSQLSEL